MTVAHNYGGNEVVGDDVVYLEVLDLHHTAVVGLTTDEAVELMEQLAAVVSQYTN